MILIGEKINGAIPSVGNAIANRDEAWIIDLVQRQEAAGADYLDVCAGTTPELEYDTLCWLIDVVQSVANKPICIDSPDPHMLLRVFPKLTKPGLVNSISMEGEKCDVLLPLLKENPDWGVVALCCDPKGIAEKAEDKFALAVQLVEKAAAYGITPDRIHIDPLVLALSAVDNSALEFCKAIRMIKEKYPSINVTAALSNISYGMPARKVVNISFLVMAIESGLDSMIADPLNRDSMGVMYATEALMQKDKYCRKYNKAYRKGIFGVKKTK